MARVEVDADWYAAGLWDSEHGLMPMSPWLVPPEHRPAYLLGYRRHPLGVKSNAHQSEKRPE